MELEFTNSIPRTKDVINLYHEAGILSPQLSQERLSKAFLNSNLTLCCYCKEELVGVLRGITDFNWIAHISHLAIHPKFQKKGIGKELIHRITKILGPEVSLTVHSAPNVKNFYETIGFQPYDDMYIVPREM